ncbi:MAG: YjiH family protein, partial [Firmicutes bacterium]|nr:YjiH family protein [Bacillota bacterium]
MESNRTSGALKFVIFSLLGIFIFFVQIKIGEYSGIPLDIFTSWLQNLLGVFASYLALAVVLAGTIKPFITGTWNKSAMDIIFTIFKIFGFIAACMVVFNFGPEPVLNADNGPYLFGSLVQPVVYMIVFGAPLLCLMVNYGLVDFVGIFVRPLTRTLWKTPGRSAVDAVSSFVGS